MKTNDKKPAHTPGPWEAVEQVNAASNARWVGIFSKTAAPMEARVAHVGNLSSGMRLTREQIEANARLIAAAPDLLEFAKLVMKWADTPEVNNNTQRVQSIMGLRAAILRATEGK